MVGAAPGTLHLTSVHHGKMSSAAYLGRASVWQHTRRHARLLFGAPLFWSDFSLRKDKEEYEGEQRVEVYGVFSCCFSFRFSKYVQSLQRSFWRICTLNQIGAESKGCSLVRPLMAFCIVMTSFPVIQLCNSIVMSPVLRDSSW